MERQPARLGPVLRAIPVAIALTVAFVIGWRHLTHASSSPAAARASAERASADRASATTPIPRDEPSPLASATPRPTVQPVQVAASQAIPPFTHIYLIVMENHEYGSIVGSSHAPYINALIHRYGLATNDHAVGHPSEPNYLALFAGSTFGIRDDGIHNLTARNLADEIEARGRTWHVYAQDLPSPCSTAATARGGVDLVGAAGSYARKHEPAISFTDVSSSSARCARITQLAGFSPTAASFELIVPNMVNDMHDGTIAQGDAFLRAFVPRITGGAAFATSLLLITWDEGTTSLGGGGRVATLVISPQVQAGFRSAVSHTHYSLLKTIENAWGLGCLNHTCTANDLREFFAH